MPGRGHCIHGLLAAQTTGTFCAARGFTAWRLHFLCILMRGCRNRLFLNRAAPRTGAAFQACCLAGSAYHSLPVRKRMAGQRAFQFIPAQGAGFYLIGICQTVQADVRWGCSVLMAEPGQHKILQKTAGSADFLRPAIFLAGGWFQDALRPKIMASGRLGLLLLCRTIGANTAADAAGLAVDDGPGAPRMRLHRRCEGQFLPANPASLNVAAFLLTTGCASYFHHAIVMGQGVSRPGLLFLAAAVLAGAHHQAAC